MATAMVLSSQNHRFDHETLIHRNPNSRLCRHSSAASTAPRRRKRSPTVVKSPAANTNLVMEQVKILKRGETLSAFKKKENCSPDDTRRPVLKMIKDVDLIVSSTNRIGPEPEILMKQIRASKGLQIFSGAICSISPLPSCVPIPCFLGKNNLLI